MSTLSYKVNVRIKIQHTFYIKNNNRHMQIKIVIQNKDKKMRISATLSSVSILRIEKKILPEKIE